MDHIFLRCPYFLNMSCTKLDVICTFYLPAMAIRFLTNRFIGSYSSHSPTSTVSRKIQVPASSGPARNNNKSNKNSSHSDLIPAQIRDVASSESDSRLRSSLSWCDAAVVLVTRDDPLSLGYAEHVFELASGVNRLKPVYLVSNKEDLEPVEKRVSLEACQELALKYKTGLAEISVMRSPVGCRFLLGNLLRALELVKTGLSKELKVSLETKKVWSKFCDVVVANWCLTAPVSAPKSKPEKV